MTAQMALVCGTAFVCVALLVDVRRTPTVSSAVWIPILWTTILASRPVATWFNANLRVDLFVSQDGTALDRNILILLMLAASITLARRRLPWARLAQGNVWVLMFFLFCGISLLWSDFFGVGFKRWVRAMGAVMVILVVASEKDPVAATAAVVRRCGIVLLPFSIILIKYFRELGVGYNYWTGQEYLVGATTDKNALGRLCLVCGLFALWELLTRKGNPHIPADAWSRWGSVLLVSSAVWLMLASDSKTSLLCFLLGGFVIALSGMPLVRKRARYLGTLILLLGGTGLLLSFSLNLPELIVAALGRDLTLTDRTFIWHDLLAAGTNPVVGVGYDTFWLGERLTWFLGKHHVNSAHNGYLETYLELGWVGLLLLVGLLVAVFAKVKHALEADASYGRLLAATLAVFLFYNITESGYKPTALISFTLLLVAMTSPGRRVETASAQVREPGPGASNRAAMRRDFAPRSGASPRAEV